jgi:hypothetical protein
MWLLFTIKLVKLKKFEWHGTTTQSLLRGVFKLALAARLIIRGRAAGPTTASIG